MGATTSYVAFSTAGDAPLTIAGRLMVPEGAAERATPAVVICHGSNGVDGRGAFYAEALNGAGLVTLEIDMWAARGSARGATARPRSPLLTLPDAFAALAFLARQPEVDPRRIGIMGFSWGGVVSLLSAAQRYSDAHRGEGPAFAAHAAFYPVLWSFMRGGPFELSPLTGAPVLVQTGADDAYDDPDAGERFHAFLPPQDAAHVRVITHPGAGHGFDRDAPAVTITDPFSHNGQGGEVVMAHHPEAAAAARAAVVDFFRSVLA